MIKNKHIKKSRQWLLNHALTVFSSVVIIAFGIVSFAYSSPGTTTIGENISTNNLTASGSLEVGGNVTTSGNLVVFGNTNLTNLTVSGNVSTTGNQAISEKLTVTGTSTFSGNVGIGTTNPDYYKLDVNGKIRGNEIRFLPRKAQALVTFIFDDGNETDYTVMKPVFDDQGEVACPAIITNCIGQDGILSAAQIIEMEGDGWEILSHSVTHPDLTTLTEAQVRAELSDSKDALEALGLTINNFVYPGHHSNEMVRRITREYYRSARGVEGEEGQGLNPHTLETYALASIHADDHANLATYQGYVDAAESGKKWLIFYLHETDSDDATAMNTLIDYIQSKNISIVTIDQALDLVGNMLDIGDNFSVGEKGMRGVIFDDTNSNTFIGRQVFNNSVQSKNTGVGYKAGYNNNHITGNEGTENTYIGSLAGYGSAAGNKNTGYANTAIGSGSLYSNSTGKRNNAIGSMSLSFNTTGDYNIAMGYKSLYSNTIGENNTAIGYQTLFYTNGSRNIAIGAWAGYRQIGNDTLIIDNRLRDDAASEAANAIIHGIMAAAPANQTLTINANVGIGTTSPDSLLHIYSTATTTLEVDSSSATKGACLKLKDSDGSGYTYCTVNNGAMNCSTTSCK